MILEGLVTTRDGSGKLNIAPMGPIVDASMKSLQLRPFKTSQTYQNLRETGCGVFHVTDDVLLLAECAIGEPRELVKLIDAQIVSGSVIASACRWYEFEVERVDDSSDRTEIQARVVHAGRLRDVFGFNRAKHAVVEAAILATRVNILPREEILRQFEKLRSPVEKTGGPREHEAFVLLDAFVREA